MEKYNLPDDYIEKLYKLAKDVSEILDKHNITYWIEGGTLLGAVRNGKQIPYDDDIDFGILLHDYQKVCELENEFTSIGYDVENNDKSIYKIYIKQDWKITKNIVIPTPTLDLFCYYNIKGDNPKICLFDRDMKKEYPNCEYKYDDLFPLINYKYGDLELKGANNPYEYLDKTYLEWKTKAVIDVRCKNPYKMKSKEFNKKIVFDLPS